MNRIHPWLYAAVALCAVAAPAAAQHRHHNLCDDERDDDDTYCEQRTVGWRATGRLSVDASPNGGVGVSGWDRDSIAITAAIHVRARTDDDAKAIAAQVQIRNDGGTLTAEGPSTGRRQSWWVSFDISAPAHTDLTLRTVNGPIAVDHVAGVMDLQAENGPIDLDQIGGDVTARAQNGPMRVTLAGTSWQGRGLDAETVNGPAVLQVPDGFNAQLETGTVNGPLDLGIPVTVQGRFGGREQRINTTLGSGGPRIRVVTTNGPAVIQRIR